ncbi:MAG: ankyrin repeat domain-containing protein, partial [Treponemataceae bacterium]|nr:ankyrin repeat domain-containing protein [Treponemataceae bacterium]
EGMTAELIAVRKRNGALLKFLESKGADLSSTDAKGNTLLHIAVKNDDIISAKFLLENGCDIYATNDAGVSVLDLMKKSRHGGIRALADDYE